MKKPIQSRVTNDNDYGDLREALDEATYHIREAMSAIKGYGELADWFTELDVIHDEMFAELENVETQIRVEHEELVREMTRDYYRSVI